MVTDPTEAYFKDGTWGWDGTQWRKLPMLWGFSEVYKEEEKDEGSAGGNVNLTFSTVPAGEVWVVEGVVAWDKDSIVTRIEIRHRGISSNARFASALLPAANVPVETKRTIILAEDDYIDVRFIGVTATDDIYATAWGYKMKIAE